MNLNNDTMNKLENAIITLKYREIPYILDEKQEKYKKRMYDFIILKKNKDIFFLKMDDWCISVLNYRIFLNKYRQLPYLQY